VSRRAQHIAEFTIVAAMVILAVSGMNLYVKRGLQGRYKQIADSVYTHSDGFSRAEGGQYEPYYLDQEFEIGHETGGHFSYDKSQDDNFRVHTNSTTSREGYIMQVPRLSSD